jgi:hypothetical protein
MATEEIEGDIHCVIASKQEIVNLIGLLVAQLANVPLVGCVHGAIPELVILEHGVVKYRLCLVPEPDPLYERG